MRRVRPPPPDAVTTCPCLDRGRVTDGRTDAITTKPGAGLNIQNLAYAAQWWIFGAFAVLLWLRLVRDEARGSGPERDVSPAEGGGAAP